MFCYNRSPSPFFGFSWDLACSAVVFDNLHLHKDQGSDDVKVVVLKIVGRMQDFSTGDLSHDPAWVGYYYDVFKDECPGDKVEDLRRVVHRRAAEMERALREGQNHDHVAMRVLCLRLHDEACGR